MFFVNKNINHNGTIYSNGAEIKIGDPGFKELLAAGHLNEGRSTVAVAPSEELDDTQELSDELLDAITAPIEEPKPKRKR